MRNYNLNVNSLSSRNIDNTCISAYADTEDPEYRFLNKFNILILACAYTCINYLG